MIGFRNNWDEYKKDGFLTVMDSGMNYIGLTDSWEFSTGNVSNINQRSFLWIQKRIILGLLILGNFREGMFQI